jgi:type III pantothenate kinase
MGMHVAVDLGNTKAKVGIFIQRELTEKHVFESTIELIQWLRALPVEGLIISSVKEDVNTLISGIPARHKIVLTSHTPLPIQLRYASPLSLGVDRIAAACGAHHLFPGASKLVIDAGTCITYDFTSANGEFLGGSISPGMHMRFKAMHTFTARLPLLTPEGYPSLLGTTTEQGMQSGVINGIREEMNGIIAQYMARQADVQVLLTGGDGPFFENQLKASIFACPNLILIGLNSILAHNVLP